MVLQVFLPWEAEVEGAADGQAAVGQDAQNQLVEAGLDGSVLPDGERVSGVGTTETRDQLSWVQTPHSNPFIGLTC